MKKKGLIFIVSGPSGVGKKSILDKIITKKELNLRYSVSSTTRSPRNGEKNGIDYYFLSKEEFDNKVKNGDFVEWAEFAGNQYGTLKSEIDRYINDGINVVLEIEVQGGQSVISQFNKDEYCSIFILPKSIEELEKRLLKRNTETKEMIKLRLKKAESELKFANLYNHVILNDELDKAADKLEKIILENINEN